MHLFDLDVCKSSICTGIILPRVTRWTLSRGRARGDADECAEVAAYMERHAEARDGEGRRLCSPQGQARVRGITCGAGTLEVRTPRVNDRRVGEEGERCRFTSRILPPYMRRSPKVAEVLPFCICGDFRRGLPPGARAAARRGGRGFSATNIARADMGYGGGVPRVSQALLGGPRLRLCVGDGVHFNVRLEEERLCTLALIGARADGQKELIAV